MSEITAVHRGQILDEFEGFDQDALFSFTNGSHWLQDEYKYWYFYSYRPQAEIVQIAGRLYLRLVGHEQRVAVRRTDVIESRIHGQFNGWDGKSEYTLTNGQTWQQAAYKYEYKYAYQPRAIVYEGQSGKLMDVAGTHARVRRLR